MRRICIMHDRLYTRVHLISGELKSKDVLPKLLQLCFFIVYLRIVLTSLNEKRFVCSVTTQTRAKRDDSHLRKLHGFHQHEMCKHYTLYRNTLYNCLLILVYKDAIKYFIIKCIGNFNFLKIAPSRDIISCVVVAFSIYECLMLIPCNVL